MGVLDLTKLSIAGRTERIANARPIGGSRGLDARARQHWGRLKSVFGSGANLKMGKNEGSLGIRDKRRRHSRAQGPDSTWHKCSSCELARIAMPGGWSLEAFDLWG